MNYSLITVYIYKCITSLILFLKYILLLYSRETMAKSLVISVLVRDQVASLLFLGACYKILYSFCQLTPALEGQSRNILSKDQANT